MWKKAADNEARATKTSYPLTIGGATDSSAHELRIQLLGGFRICIGRQFSDEAEWPLRKARSLVKLLALAPDHRVHRERIIDLLWPDLDATAGANNLYYVLHKARCVLKPAAAETTPALVLRRGWVALQPAYPPWVDVTAFEAAAAAALHAQTPQAYWAALKLYGGELLPEDPYEDWAIARRRELHTCYLKLLLELAQLYQQQGEIELAIEVLCRLTVHEPVHEEGHIALMRLYAASGQRYQALSQYRQLEETLQQELDAQPGPASRQLYRELLDGCASEAALEPAAASSSAALTTQCGPAPAPTNLPCPRTGFIGRKRESEEVRALLRQTQLLTLTGAGGSGKTRLALHVAAQAAEEFPDGVWLVQLESLSDPRLVPQAVATALGLREEPGRLLAETIAAYLQSRRLLLLLDNCEHLMAACAELIDTLLSAHAQLHILATSRETLGIRGETVLLIPPLSLPDLQSAQTLADLGQAESVQLFIERARLIRPGFELSEHNAYSIARLCCCLDGLPLAIELAAARMRVLSPEQILERLTDRFRLLFGGERTAPPRHQTLWAVVDWSYALLTEDEQAVFAQCGVFRGGWTLEAAERIIELPHAWQMQADAAGGWADGGHPPPSTAADPGVLEMLARLVDKSLTVAEPGADGAMRYRLLETLRYAAYERMEKCGRLQATQRRHAAYYLQWAQQAVTELRGCDQALRLMQLEREHDNLRQALHWSCANDQAEIALQLGATLWRFWHKAGQLSEAQEWLEAGLDCATSVDPATRAAALSALGKIARDQGRLERAANLQNGALTLFRQLDDWHMIAKSLISLGHVAGDQGDYARASQRYEESLQLSERLNDRWTTALALYNLGATARDLGEYERATALSNRSLELFGALQDRWGVAISLYNLGRVAHLRGDNEQAKALCQESLHLRSKLGIKAGITGCLDALASITAALARPEQAARLCGAAEALREALGSVLLPDERAAYNRLVDRVRHSLSPQAFELAWEEGRTLSIAQVITYALAL